MSATTSATKTKTASSPEAKTAKSDRAEINRRNAQRSTGPRSAEGKDRCRFNALKHGLTARSTLLPGEDADEIEARQKELPDDLRPRNRARLLLRLEGTIAGCDWRLDRWAGPRNTVFAKRTQLTLTTVHSGPRHSKEINLEHRFCETNPAYLDNRSQRTSSLQGDQPRTPFLRNEPSLP